MEARRLAWFAALAVGAACATAPAPVPPAAAVAPTAAAAPAAVPAPAPGLATGLELVVDPKDALVSVDGTPRGSVADLAAAGGVLALPPGIYQVSLQSPGYVTWRAEVAVRTARERIEVRLVKKP
jgi:hypothetical protein